MFITTKHDYIADIVVNLLMPILTIVDIVVRNFRNFLRITYQFSNWITYNNECSYICRKKNDKKDN